MKEYKQSKYISILLIIFILIASPKIVNGLISANLINTSGATVDFLRFDRENQTIGNNTYGSNSYMDHSFTNPNLFLNVCHPNLKVGDKIDIVYTGINQSYYSSVLNFFPRVTSTTNHSDINGTYNCSTVDVSLSSIHALYPGYIHPVIIPQGIDYSHSDYNMNQSYFFQSLNQTLNGSYDIGIDITGLTKIYHITIEGIFDEQGQEIQEDVNEPYLVVTLVNSSDAILTEEKIAPSGTVSYDADFKGGEHVYVNEIDSLEILSYSPCDPINESGYYLFNDSATSLNDTCIIINNSENIVLNFGGELIDGDGSISGSFAPERCAIIIQNSNKIIMEYVRSQEFYNGICIKNSTEVSIYGNYSSYNLQGAKVYNESVDINFYSVYFSNNNSEIVTLDDSEANLTNVSFASARIKVKMRDARIKTVLDPPPAPDVENLTDIDQYVEFDKLSDDSYIMLGFHYSLPLPENVSLNDVSIYQFRGERDSNSSTGWNASVNWTPIYTVVDPQQDLIMSFGPDAVITNFSVFAPFGFPNVTNRPEPEPTPEPEPSPSPTAGQSGSRGAQPREIQLKLEIPNNITLMQGEVGEIKFNVSNIGTVFAPYVMVGPEVLIGWDYTNDTIGDMQVGSNVSGEFQIAPHESTTPKEYEVIVNAYIKKDGEVSIVTSKILKVIVKPRREGLNRLKILEYPPVIQASPSSVMNISFLAKNIGGVFLKDIIIDIEDSPCINSIKGKHDLAVDETKSLKYLFNFTSEINDCDVNIKFYSNNILVGFLSSKILLREEFRPEATRNTYIIILYLIWTTITAYVVGRRRKHKKEKKRNEIKIIE